MQSLALDVNVVSEEGQRTEMRDEDDDLLRAAEELGIDLSGVRAATGESSDEELEGEDTTDSGAPEGDGKSTASGEGDAGAENVDLEDLDSEVSAE
jgi:DNA-directed RNA polymerase subunit beta